MFLPRSLYVSAVVLTVTVLAAAQTSPTPSPQPQAPAAAPASQNSGQASSPAAPNNAANQNSKNSEAERERSGVDPLLDPRPLPNHPATLIGGTVSKLDRIRDRMAVRPFGGGKMDVAFDVRTKIYRDGQPGTIHDIKPGSRVYLDTMLNGDQVFARTIRVQTQGGQGDARGQVVSYDGRHQILTIREQVSPQPIKLRLTQQTSILTNGKPGSLADLERGALVTVQFEPGGNDRDVARTIHVLATPGATFTFAGIVTFLDLRAGRMAIDNRTDGQNYELLMESVPSSMIRELRVGSDAVVKAVFDGENYQARSIEVVNRAANSQSQP